tara:strand:- start:1151 stop:2446 length:1296 start_codon:yes stop_codon:yes gene_type:complete
MTEIKNTLNQTFGEEEKHLLQECIHCGFCLSDCPTYIANGKEMDSPRGRLHLMGSALNGDIELTDSFLEHINLCLVCRACETACPSGVQFGHLMEKTRSAVYSENKLSLSTRVFLKWIISSHFFLSILSFGLWCYQKLGGQWLTTQTPLKYVISSKIRQIQQSLAKVPLKRFGKRKTQHFKADGEKRGTSALFTGCVMDHWFAGVHKATVRILQWNGWDVIVPKEQFCCGALHSHAGDSEMARSLAEKNIQQFNDLDVDVILVNSAGCGTQLKNYSRISSDYGNAETFVSKIRDVTEFLASHDLKQPEKPLNLNIVYDEPCHLIHGQGISDEPKQLIESIPGITLLPLPEADKCCGSAGSYSLTQMEMSLEILERKMDFIEASGADTVITANPGCQMQLQWGIKKRNLPMKVYHIMELLDRAYSTDEKYLI